MSKKLVTVAGIVIALVLIVGGGAVAYTQLRPNTDKIFSKYLESTAASKSVASKETATASGSTLTAIGTISDSASKTMINISAKCEGNMRQNPVNVSASMQYENESLFLRLDSINGQFIDSQGTDIDLAPAYANAVGKWYALPPDEAIKSQLDNKVLLSSTGVMAPTHNAKDIAEELISSKAITYEYDKKDGDNFVYKVTANRSEYENAAKELFPDLPKQDLIMDSIFGDSDTKRSTIVITKDSELVKETYSEENICVSVAENYLGETPSGISERMEVVGAPSSDVNIAPITNSAPIEQLLSDLSQ